MDLPTKFTKLESTPANGTVPSNIDPSTISYICESLPVRLSFFACDLYTAVGSPYNNQGVNFRSELDDDGAVTGTQGWTSVETVLVRFDTSFTPSGRFPVHFNWSWPGESGLISRMGYDAAVCVQKYEPWVTETYNTSTRSTSTLEIIGTGNGSTPPSPDGKILGAPITDITRNLNTTGKDLAFAVARKISINQLIKLTTGQGAPYVPSPTVGTVIPRIQHFFRPQPPSQAVSFTEGLGAGPGGYIELSPDRFGAIRARAEAGNALPYLVGSGLVVAQSYGDETLADATFKQWQLIGPLLLILFLGIIGELFVPALPRNIPRREFGVYSWLALFQSQARVLSRVPRTRTNWSLTFRSCDSRQLATLRNS